MLNICQAWDFTCNIMFNLYSNFTRIVPFYSHFTDNKTEAKLFSNLPKRTHIVLDGLEPRLVWV